MYGLVGLALILASLAVFYYFRDVNTSGFSSPSGLGVNIDSVLAVAGVLFIMKWVFDWYLKRIQK